MTAWPGLKTWEIVTEALHTDLNSYVRDALDNLYDAPRLALTRSTALAIAAAGTAIAWTTENEDAFGFHAANSTDIVIPAGMDGLYVVFARQEMAADNAAGAPTSYGTTLEVNAYNITTDFQPRRATQADTMLMMGTLWPFAAGDTLKVFTFHDAAHTINLKVTSAYSPFFGMVWVAP